MGNDSPNDETVIEWPNKHEIPDGVVPVSEVPQDPDAVEDDFDAEMED